MLPGGLRRPLEPFGGVPPCREHASDNFPSAEGDAGGLSNEPAEVEHLLVISLESAYLMASSGSPGFVLGPFRPSLRRRVLATPCPSITVLCSSLGTGFR